MKQALYDFIGLFHFSRPFVQKYWDLFWREGQAVISKASYVFLASINCMKGDALLAKYFPVAKSDRFVHFLIGHFAGHDIPRRDSIYLILSFAVFILVVLEVFCIVLLIVFVIITKKYSFM